MRTLLTAALGLLALAACDTSTPDPTAASEVSLTTPTAWTLVAFSEADDFRPSTIAFADSNGTADTIWEGDVAGRAACNSYDGSFTTADPSGGEIGVIVDGITEIACGDDPGALDYERDFVEALEAVMAFELTADGRLTMTGADDLELVFEQAGE